MLDFVFEQIAKEFLSAITRDLDQYTSQKGEIIVTNDSEIVLLTPAHIQFAKYGRGPGKKPPLDNILEWVGREGIIFDNMDKRGTALAIQASIGVNGTSNWQPNAPDTMSEAINTNSQEYQKKLNNLIITEIHGQYNDALRKVYPPKVDVKI